MFCGLLMRTDIQTCASVSENRSLRHKKSGVGGMSPLTGNADVVNRAGISGTQHQRLAVGAERLLGLISIRKRRAQAVP